MDNQPQDLTHSVYAFGDHVVICMTPVHITLTTEEAEELSKALAGAVTEIAGRAHTRELFEPHDG